MQIFSNTEPQDTQMLFCLLSFFKYHHRVTLNRIHLYHQWPKQDHPGILWCKTLWIACTL